MPQLTYLEAIRQGIWEEMERDPAVFCLGEDIGIYGGAFKITDHLWFCAALAAETFTAGPFTRRIRRCGSCTIRA